MSHAIRVGIIGSGRVGVDWHLPDIRDAGGDVVALADTVPGRAAKFASERKVPKAFDDYHDLLNCDEVDAVSICTPPISHLEITEAAFEAGKHVYLEKPPALNATEMQKILDAADASGLCFLVGSNAVYHHHIQLIKQRIEAGALGEIYYVEALKLIRRNYKKGWHRLKAVAGGGVGMDSCPHRLDLALFLLDNPQVHSVTARTYDYFVNQPVPRTAQDGYQLMDVAEGVVLQADAVPADVEDSLVAFIQFDGGTTMLLRDISSAHSADDLSLKLFGTQGGISVYDRMFYTDDAQGLPVQHALDSPPSSGGAHVLAFEHFFQCIREGKRTFSDGHRALNIMRIIDAIYASAANGGRQVLMEAERD